MHGESQELRVDRTNSAGRAAKKTVSRYLSRASTALYGKRGIRDPERIGSAAGQGRGISPKQRPQDSAHGMESDRKTQGDTVSRRAFDRRFCLLRPFVLRGARRWLARTDGDGLRSPVCFPPGDG